MVKLPEVPVATKAAAVTSLMPVADATTKPEPEVVKLMVSPAANPPSAIEVWPLTLVVNDPELTRLHAFDAALPVSGAKLVNANAAMPLSNSFFNAAPHYFQGEAIWIPPSVGNHCSGLVTIRNLLP